MPLSRKLKRMLNDSKEQSLSNEKEQLPSNENVKRRRNCRTVDDNIKSKTKLSVDFNQNKVNKDNLAKRGEQSSVSRTDSKTEICEEECNVTKNEINESQYSNLDPFQREIIVSGLGKRDRVPEMKGYRGHWEKSNNMLHYFQQLTYGNRCRLELRKVGAHALDILRLVVRN